MSGLGQLLSTGVTGLQAAIQAMETVSNNTANVNTPGYNVESVVQSELRGLDTGPGIGTEVSGVRRAFNQYAYQALVQAGSANQAAQTVQTNAQNLATIFPVASGGAGGLGASLTTFFAAANQVAQNPADLTGRQVFVSDAQALVENFNSVGGQLAQTLANLNDQVTAAVAQVNALTGQIAALNSQIAAQAGSLSGANNSLLDNRDSLVQQLGQELGLILVPEQNGAIDIYTSGGAALVSGNTSVPLAAAPGAYADGTVTVTYGPSGQDLSDRLTGGTLGGLIAARAQTAAAQESVGALAAALSQAVNAQQALGLDLNGQLGTALFTAPGPSVYAARTNTGGGSLGAAITDMAGFTPGDFVVTRTAAGFTATNLATGAETALGSGPTLSLDGMTLTVAGTVNVGDSFEVKPNAQTAQGLALATGDPGAVAAASPYVVTAASNVGNVTAAPGGPQAIASLPAGVALVPAAQFGGALTVRFTSATQFDVLDSGNAVVASGSFSAVNGAEIAIAYPAPAGEAFTVTLSGGTPAAGDSFALTPGGPGSNGNMVALAGLADRPALAGQTLSGAYAGLVATIGGNGQAAGVAAQAAAGVLAQATSVQQSISGVNLDEQAANLVSFQQAYQAAATVIATAQTLFDTLLAAVRAG
jgi:flagellar hook-associated protein 1 FlgK